jgi:tetratricopeptide (TPR) repeat protein
MDDDYMNSLDVKIFQFLGFGLWLREHSDSGRILQVLCTRLNEEHERRLQQYGQNDSRTERIRLFLGTIQNTCGFTGARDMGAWYKNTRVANDSFDIKPMVQVLQKEGPFPPHFGLDLLLKLQTYIRQFEKLTDPLQMLFRAIVRKASALPILALLLVAMFYYRVGREEDCLEILTVALAKVKGKEGPLQFLILESIASVYDQLGQHEMAWAHWSKALDGLEKNLGPDHEYTLFTIYLIGLRSYRLGKYTDALSSFMTVFSRHEKKLPRRQLDFYRHISYDMGRAYVKLHQYQEALPFLSAALSSPKKLFGQKEVNEPHKLVYMGITYLELGKYMEALDALHKALGGLEKRYGEEHRDTLFVQREIGIVHTCRGEYKEGVLFLSKALSGLQKYLEEEDKGILSTLYWMGVAYMNGREYRKALDILSRALPGLQMVCGPDHPYTLRAISLIEDARGRVHFPCRTEQR